MHANDLHLARHQEGGLFLDGNTGSIRGRNFECDFMRTRLCGFGRYPHLNRHRSSRRSRNFDRLHAFDASPFEAGYAHIEDARRLAHIHDLQLVDVLDEPALDFARPWTSDDPVLFWNLVGRELLGEGEVAQEEEEHLERVEALAIAAESVEEEETPIEAFRIAPCAQLQWSLFPGEEETHPASSGQNPPAPLQWSLFPGEEETPEQVLDRVE